MHWSRFSPKGGDRNRAMVRSALSIYEESMGDHLGFRGPAEASEIQGRLRARGSSSRRQLQMAESVVRVRNNLSHFSGAAFGYERALNDVHAIADALGSFGLIQSSARVREIIPGERGPSLPRRGRASPQGLSPGLLAVLAGVVVFLPVYLALNEIGVQKNAGSWSIVPAALVGFLVYIKQSRKRGS